ncbi:MAG: L-threonylcarbamoyladenylate synthase [Candidatus Omnitrophica bacterium]|nr:L-threonylcarbamoyladenylate synthase [Candidatus Omnitrophota bacterium]
MTIVVRIDALRPEAAKIKEAASALRNGGLVGFPTETVYGIGANLLDARAVKRLYGIKKRPSAKPLTVHVTCPEDVKKMAGRIPLKAARLMKKYWPGPLTLVLKDKRGGKTGFRMPDNRIALKLIRAAGVPVVAPSANISGSKPPVSAKEVLRDLDGKIDVVIDGGRTKVGKESTVVDMSGRIPVILREGAIPGPKIREVADG